MLAYFPHIPKTGGQTLLRGFYRAFGQKRCLKVWSQESPDIVPSEFQSLAPCRFKKLRAVVGHLPMWQFLSNKHAADVYGRGRMHIFTSVRDPIDRIISLYNYVRYFQKHPAHESIQQVDPIQFILHQPANSQLDFIKPNPSAGLDEVFECMEVVAVEVSMEALTTFLKTHFGRRVKLLSIKNQSESYANGQRLLRREDLPEDLIGELNQRHALDLELHRRALGRQATR